MSPIPKPGVLDISAYVGGRAPAADADEIPQTVSQ